MKIKLVSFALRTFAVGVAVGLMGRDIISPAIAAENRMIFVTGTDADVANQCNFDKTIWRGYTSIICVRK